MPRAGKGAEGWAPEAWERSEAGPGAGGLSKMWRIQEAAGVGGRGSLGSGLSEGL